jgi:hypothetical protein
MPSVAAWALVVVVSSLVCVNRARAEEPTTRAEEPTGSTEDPARPPAAFPVGTEYFSLSGAFQNERTGEDRYLATASAGFGRYFYDNAAFEWQIVGYGTHDEDEALGMGGNALLRYHFLNIDRFSLYGDVLGGVFVLTDDFPTGGTALNFTYAGGPGASWRLRDRLYLSGGVRFQHVSNAFISGRDRNPIFNSFGGYVGFMWTR